MTVVSRLRATLASLEGVLADFKAAYNETKDSNARNLLNGLIVQTEDVASKLKRRIEFIESEEPQYKEGS